jgi:peptidoglycan/LPS O-acetylase OafA/YrhL
MLPRRLVNLDFARGVASLWVVLWHWQHFAFIGGYIPQDFDIEGQPFYTFLSPFYQEKATVAVSFFFTLSGFVFFWLYLIKITNRQCDAREFLINRVARLYPLHFATLCLVTLLQLVYHTTNGDWFVYQSNDLYHWILNLLFISSWGPQTGLSFNGPVWSVSIEVGLYLLFFFFARFAPANIYTTVLIIIICDTGRRLELHAIWPEAIECFFIGGLCFLIIDRYLSCRRHPSCEIALFVATIVGWLSFLYWPGCRELIDRWGLTFYLLLPGAIISLVLLETRGFHVGPKLAWIGDTTYATYLLHFPLQLIFVLVANPLGLADQIAYSRTAFLLFMTLLFFISVVTYEYFERPAQKYFRDRWHVAKR